MWSCKSASATTTRRLGYELAAFLVPGDVIGLVGDLGAGKTTFIQGLADGLGLPAGVYVNSPTFTIVNDYPTTPHLTHFDFYRLSSADELEETGYEDAARGEEGVCVVEWFDLFTEAHPRDYLQLTIHETPSGRELQFSPQGLRWQDRLNGWKRVQPMDVEKQNRHA